MELSLGCLVAPSRESADDPGDESIQSGNVRRELESSRDFKQFVERCMSIRVAFLWLQLQSAECHSVDALTKRPG